MFDVKVSILEHIIQLDSSQVFGLLSPGLTITFEFHTLFQILKVLVTRRE